MSRPTLPPSVVRVATFLSQPPVALEILLWTVLVAVTIGMRVYLWHLLPAYIWSDDGNSYAASAFRWFDGGEMIFDGRRGPTYTLLIAAGLKIFGVIRGVIWLQHGLSALAVLISIATARVWWGRKAVIPLFACGLALGLYGLPLHMGQLVRNETLLLIFSAISVGAWWLALKSDRLGWYFLAALSCALLTMTKNVFVVFPLVLFAGVFFYAAAGWKAKLIRLAVVVAGLAAPTVALKIHDARASKVAVPEPQAGILFYGRTAQWTKLDGGINQDLKDLIRQDIEDYRKQYAKKPDNNIIIKRTAVPHLWQALHAQGKTPTELDRLCKQFAIEAVRDQPAEFARQIRKDLVQLQFDAGVKNEFPSDKQIVDARKSLRELGMQREFHPTMEAGAMDAILVARMEGDPFQFFRTCLNRAWMFQGRGPVFFTTISLLLLAIFTRGKERFFFLGIAAIWFSNMALLSTVGRPLERYLMPLVPIMFWAMTGVIVTVWTAILRMAGGLTPLPASPTTDGPQET